jgi:hypothetical protein
MMNETVPTGQYKLNHQIAPDTSTLIPIPNLRTQLYSPQILKNFADGKDNDVKNMKDLLQLFCKELRQTRDEINSLMRDYQNRGNTPDVKQIVQKFSDDLKNKWSAAPQTIDSDLKNTDFAEIESMISERAALDAILKSCFKNDQSAIQVGKTLEEEILRFTKFTAELAKTPFTSYDYELSIENLEIVLYLMLKGDKDETNKRDIFTIKKESIDRIRYQAQNSNSNDKSSQIPKTQITTSISGSLKYQFKSLWFQSDSLSFSSYVNNLTDSRDLQTHDDYLRNCENILKETITYSQLNSLQKALKSYFESLQKLKLKGEILLILKANTEDATKEAICKYYQSIYAEALKTSCTFGSTIVNKIFSQTKTEIAVAIDNARRFVTGKLPPRFVKFIETTRITNKQIQKEGDLKGIADDIFYYCRDVNGNYKVAYAYPKSLKKIQYFHTKDIKIPPESLECYKLVIPEVLEGLNQNLKITNTLFPEMKGNWLNSDAPFFYLVMCYLIYLKAIQVNATAKTVSEVQLTVEDLRDVFNPQS